MKSKFNSKMSSSPFYIGPSVYVDDDSGWSFSKKQSNFYKYLAFTLLVCIAVAITII